jgi:signal peptidase II
MKISKGAKLAILGIILVVIDQVIKVLVKTNMGLGEVIPVIGNWFRLCFVENEGMAFGMKFGGVIGKVLLSVFRVVLTGFLVWWIGKLIKKGDTPVGVLIGLTLITAGAFGNIIDSFFYGIIWPELRLAGAPFGFMFGKVVDMFSATFFPPVFNFADSCVTVGAIYLILFQYKFFAQD